LGKAPRRKAPGGAVAARMAGSQRIVVGCLSVGLFLAAWQFAASTGAIDPLFISSPSRIVATAFDMIGEADFWRDVSVSAQEFLYGYVAAIIVGVPLGLLTGWYRRLHYLLGPVIDMLNAVPRVTFLPIIILWFGIGIWSKFTVAFLGAVIPIAISTFSGVRTSEDRFLNVARSFSASQSKLFTSIILPGTVPFIFTGLKFGSGRALVGVVVGELYASTAGLGHMIADAGNTFQTDTVFFGVLAFTMAGMVITAVLDKLESRFSRWRPQADTV
jgi:ABC-type nitrate/sulfonate/bicarbonate transport system permease component